MAQLGHGPAGRPLAYRPPHTPETLIPSLTIPRSASHLNATVVAPSSRPAWPSVTPRRLSVSRDSGRLALALLRRGTEPGSSSNDACTESSPSSSSSTFGRCNAVVDPLASGPLRLQRARQAPRCEALPRFPPFSLQSIHMRPSPCSFVAAMAGACAPMSLAMALSPSPCALLASPRLCTHVCVPALGRGHLSRPHARSRPLPWPAPAAEAASPRPRPSVLRYCRCCFCLLKLLLALLLSTFYCRSY